MITYNLFVEELKKQAGTQLGSNEGGIHLDTDTGEKHYIKHYRNPDQAKVEALTGKIYDHMGIKTLNPEYKEIDGKPSISTKWNDKLKTLNPEDYHHLSKDQAHDIGKMYHGAVLTKNWDIVGLVHDNIMKNHETGKLHAVDHGGAFHFRAQGGPKDYDADIGEHHSLKHNSNASGHVFSTVFSQHPTVERESLDSVKNINDNHVHKLFKNSGLHNWQDLHKNFMERKAKLLNHYGE